MSLRTASQPTAWPSRRRALGLGGALASLVAWPAIAQSPRPGQVASGRAPVVAQIVDLSASQQDVSRDFLVGSRCAWQEFNGRAGQRGRPIQHLSLETDGSDAALAAAVRQALDLPGCVALVGSCGTAASMRIGRLLRQAGADLAHVAPWFQNSEGEIDERTFPIFAGRQEQIAHAIRSLGTISLSEFGVVYGTEADRGLYGDDVARSAQAAGLRVQSFGPAADLRSLGQRLAPGTPAVLLFIGGTPELAQFAAGLEKQQRQRYVVAMADVNPQVLQQTGAARHTPVIVTQAVPLVTAALPVVRGYRESLARLFDEPPSPLSLSGYISARFAQEVLQDLALPTRASSLQAFQRRAAVDVGGFRVSSGPLRRNGAFVTQSMLTVDGRVIG